MGSAATGSGAGSAVDAGSGAGSGSGTSDMGSGSAVIGISAGVGSGSAASPPPPEEEQSGFKKWAGFPPLGSFLYATSVAEVGLTFGSWPGAGGFGTGFHYAERGGLFSTWLLVILGNAGAQQAAQQRANETGQTQYYEQYSPEQMGKTGMTIDAYSTQLGGNMSGILFDLYGVFRLKKESQLPWCIDFGLDFYAFDGPDKMTPDPMNPMTMKTDDRTVAGLGFLLALLAPVTKWAQLEIKLRPVLPSSSDSWLTVEATGTANIGNKLYARASFVRDLQSQSGILFGVGGRL